MSSLRISVALCTYNGAAFVREQLDSIAAQKHLPAELIVCDDGSIDGTVDIVEEFARTAAFPVRVHRNERNLGLARNFGQAIGLGTGDIIALSDQDDVWLPTKLETFADAFQAHPSLTLVFSDAQLTDRDLKPMDQRLSDTGHIDASARHVLSGPGAFEFLLRRNIATGATMAFRSTLRDLILPIPEKLLTYHDAWIVQLAAATSTIDFIPEPLMLYRQHPGQHTWDFVYVHGAKRALDKSYYADHLHQLVELRNRLAAHNAPADPIALVDANIEHLRRRSTLPAGRLGRIGPVLSELASGRYTRFSSGWRSAARDVFGN